MGRPVAVVAGEEVALGVSTVAEAPATPPPGPTSAVTVATTVMTPTEAEEKSSEVTLDASESVVSENKVELGTEDVVELAKRVRKNVLLLKNDDW